MSKKACILVAQGVQDEEFIYPYYRLQEDFEVDVAFVSTEKYNKPVGKYGIPFNVTYDLKDFSADEIEFDLSNRYNVFIVPGGWQAPEIMRMDSLAKYLIRTAFHKNKIIGAICHGPQVLISSLVGKEKRMTAFPGIKDDVINFGAVWSDERVVVDGNLVTAQHYKDNPEFMQAVLAQQEK